MIRVRQAGNVTISLFVFCEPRQELLPEVFRYDEQST